jgi:hypothetical protein
VTLNFFEFPGRNVIEYESNSILSALVEYAMGHLVIDLIGVPDLKAIWPTINDKPHSRISGNWHVNPVAASKRRL